VATTLGAQQKVTLHMSQIRELSRLLSFREPASAVFSALEAVEDPTDYSRRIKRGAFATGSNKIWLKTPGFEAPEVDFRALRRAGRTEPLFRRRANRFQNLIWKNGYVLKTEDDDAQAYILSRMELFGVLAGESFDSFLRKVSRELIMFDNCVIWERRVPTKDLKKMGVNIPLKGIGPLSKKGAVVSYEILPIDTLEFKRDQYGNVTKWRQIITPGYSVSSGANENTKEYDPQEIILIKNDEESGDVLSYPALQMVLPDARILRQLETDASLAAHRLAFPIFKYKVGTPTLEATLPKKDEVISDIWYELEGMLLEGALIMPGSDDFEVVLSDVKLDGLSSIMDYFKSRVIIGLGLSPIQVGDASDAANRSVADRLDVQLYDDVKAFQKTLQEAFTFFIFTKWLMEGGFNLAIGEERQSESKVALLFKEIDTDSLIKRENHKLQLWVQDAISHKELRSELGLTPAEDMTDFYSFKIGEITAKFQQMASQAAAQKTAGGDGQGSNAKTKAKKTSSLPIEDEITSFRQLVSLFKEDMSAEQQRYRVDAIWGKMEEDVIDYIRGQYPEDAGNFIAKDLGYVQSLYQIDIEDALRFDVTQYLELGLDRGFEEARAIDPELAPMRMTMFNMHTNKIISSLCYYIDKLVVDLTERIEKEVHRADVPFQGVELAFEALHYRLDSVVATHMALAENWGVCIVAMHAEIDKVWQDSEPDCIECHSQWLDVKSLEPQSVPPFSTHPHCGCKVHIIPQ
jgi:hypothetical protein